MKLPTLQYIEGKTNFDSDIFIPLCTIIILTVEALPLTVLRISAASWLLQGVSLLGSLGNMLVFLMLSRPKYSIVTLSMPIPPPA